MSKTSNSMSTIINLLLTVVGCKASTFFPLDSQLETEIHSFSESPPRNTELSKICLSYLSFYSLGNHVFSPWFTEVMSVCHYH